MSALAKRTTARSISRPARERLQQGPVLARVLAVFEHACDLVTQDGEVVALVTPFIGDGPLNIVVDGGGGLFAGVERGSPVQLEIDWLLADRLQVFLGAARLWEPRPDWEALRARNAAVRSCLPLMHSICLRHAPSGSLFALLAAPVHAGALDSTILSAARKAADALRKGPRGGLERWQEGAMGLAGLGGGLTPAGDDFLCGAMLGAWLAHPDPDPFCRALAEVAVPRTTVLSAAFLRAAARGEFGAPWHALLGALSESLENEIKTALQEILVLGATSGADALAGFLFLMMDTAP